MNKNNELSEKLSLAGNLFTFTNNTIKCTITNKICNDTKKDFLLLERKESANQYGFAPKAGLIQTSNNNNESVLRSFLSCSFNDTESTTNFINKYGFLISLDDKKLYMLNHRKLFQVIARFRYLLLLIQNIKRIDEIKTIGDKKRIYDQIYDFTTLLIFGDPLQMIPSGNEVDFRVVEINPVHKAIWAEFDFENYYENIVEKNECSNLFRYQSDEKRTEIFQEGMLEPDGLVFPNNPIDQEYVRDTIELYLSANFFQFKKYNFLYGVNGIGNLVSSWNFTDIFKNPDKQISKLIEIAKRTIKYEFDYALRGIHPTLNVDTLSADWEIPNLLSALYFALFYQSEDEIYRPCANPKCKNVFPVSRTNFKKKYCCPDCQNRAAQARHRKKMQMNKTSKN